ncbi:hypothetical protein QR98_0093390 [Sarcoptes scabiei]|uniref:Uncharacterized protein n=1 Tax=Sarcoptes scabiei TaxID=52283 RepID=A0A132AIE8_SARSC|nr:hypothetical protein QR98_0093390 [Sarcoptes scabiei]
MKKKNLFSLDITATTARRNMIATVRASRKSTRYRSDRKDQQKRSKKNKIETKSKLVIYRPDKLKTIKLVTSKLGPERLRMFLFGLRKIRRKKGSVVYDDD